MSVAHLLQTLGICTAPPVPPRKIEEGTGNYYIKQRCTPCSPRSPDNQRGTDTNQKVSPKTSPAEMLEEVARRLTADVHMLGSLLSKDDMRAIADGHYSRELLVSYFRQMESDGRHLADPQWHLDHLLQQAARAASRRSLKTHRDAQWKMEWKAAHELFLNHILSCHDCCGRVGRYCGQGAKLRQHYNAAYRGQSETTEG